MHLGPVEVHFGWRERRRIDGMQAVYGNVLFRSLAMGLIGVFAPVFIFLTMKEVGGGFVAGIRWMMLYVVIKRLVVLVGAVKAGQLIEKIGYRWGVMVGVVFQILVLVMLMLAEVDYRWLLGVAVAAGMVILFYWISRLALFADDGKKDKFGEAMGVVAMLERGSSILAPLVGGVVVASFGFRVLFALGIGLLLVSIVPLFFMSAHQHGDGVSWQGAMKFWKKKGHRKLGLGFLGRGMEDLISLWMWPIFSFIVIGGFEKLGAVTSGVMVISVLTAFLVGKLFDKRLAKGGMEDEKIFWAGTLVTGVTRFCRSFAGSVWGVFGWDALTKMAAPFYWIPFGSYRALAAKKVSPVVFYSYRALIYSSGRILMALLVMVLIGLAEGWSWVFAVGAVGVVLGLGMSQESSK